MESPVRICFGAALVVPLLLLSSTVVCNALPHDTNSTAVKDDRNARYARVNGTAWVPKHNAKLPDSLNELNPKESVSEEHTEKNAKYKDRGRVRFGSQLKSTTESPLKRVKSTTETPKINLVIVTPTPEVKKPAQIIDSMRTYKKTKLPLVTSTTTPIPVSVKTETSKTDSEEEEDYGWSTKYDDEDDDKSIEKFTTGKLFDNTFYTIPSYNDDFSHYTGISSEKKGKNYHSDSFGGFSTYFPKNTHFGSDVHASYKSESFFDFNSDLTTPKNDYFDKKFKEISKSIESNLASKSTKTPPPNATNVHKIIKENIGIEKLGKDTPSNKSRVIIKNTKEIRLLDNDKAGSTKQELSDVHGTSIYYEMSVLSTETYASNNYNDDDCDGDKLPSDPTVSTSAEEEMASIKATQPSFVPPVTKPSFPDPSPESLSTVSSNYLPLSSILPSIFNSASPIPVSTQNVLYPHNTLSPTDKTVKVYSTSFTRNRSYSKRLNLAGSKDSPNNVTPRTDQTTLNHNLRQPTRRFHHTTPKTKPQWMSPKRNITRFSRPTNPSTIYSEHFNIKDRFSTVRPNFVNKTTLTTVSTSEIDPVLQSDISGIKKVVHSPSISDNSIPSLSKRGSTKFGASTASSEEAGVSEMELPLMPTAWALASLISPPSMSSRNVTSSTQKSVDENELQKVGEVTDKKEIVTSTTTSTSTMNNDIVSKKVIDIEQNKLPWKPVYPSTTSKNEMQPDTKSSDIRYEKLPAETTISQQSSDTTIQPTEEKTEQSNIAINTIAKPKPTWIPVTETEKTTTEESQEDSVETIPPVDVTKSTGFESITKLPAGLTTPQDDSAPSSDKKTDAITNLASNMPTTTDYEITTIRFSYGSTEAVTESDEMEDSKSATTEYSWHPMIPTRTMMTIEDSPITTYRPKFITTTEEVEETTTTIPETPPPIEVSSQIIESTSDKEPLTTDAVVETTTVELTTPIVTTTKTTEATTTTTTTIKPTTEAIEETTRIVTETVTEIATEINTERQRPHLTTEYITSTEVTESQSEEVPDCTSEENSVSNEVITQQTKTTTTEEITTQEPVTIRTTTAEGPTEKMIETITQQSEKILETTTEMEESTVESSTDLGTRSVNGLEDLSFGGDSTTEAIQRVSGAAGDDENGSGAAVAIAVSTIGVIALVLLIGLLLVVRRRGRRGVYAQRCTPVSLDAYSLDSVSVGHRKGNHRLRASKRSYGNPAYDDEVTSHPMQYAALANFAMDVESMTAEFAEIPSVTVRPDEVPPGCEDKNRYSNVLPLPETRVPLKRLGNDPTTEYINANYVTGPGNIRNYYIACQAPLANTVVDFWRMVWEQNSRLVVMLTEYMENGVEKCYEYLPPSEISDNKRTFGDFQIILKKREQRDKYAISTVQLVNLGSRTWREVTHLWYFWPAKGVPDDFDSVIDFLSEMRSYMKISQTAKEYDEEGVEVIYGDQNRSSFNNLSKLREDNGSSNGVNVYSPAKAEEMMRRGGHATNGTLGRMKAASEIEGVRPCVVTCASGAGRAACVMAADVCARALCAAAADVPRVVRELRAQRPHSLTNRQHYIFLYRLLSEYGNKLMGGGVDTI